MNPRELKGFVLSQFTSFCVWIQKLWECTPVNLEIYLQEVEIYLQEVEVNLIAK